MPFAGVRRNKDGSEDNIRLTNGQYHRRTKYNVREKWRKKLTQDIDEKMKKDRESKAEQPGPRCENHDEYAEHIIKHFNEALTAYCQYEYALQDLLHYIEIQRAMNRLANELIDGKKTVFFVGDCFIAANCPAKGYRRIRTRMLFKILERKKNCLVVYVDEFRTTMLCSFCFRVLEKPKVHGVVDMRQRYYVCRGCVARPEAEPAKIRIKSIKNRRKLREQRQNRPLTEGSRKASKLATYTVNDTEANRSKPRTVIVNRDVNAGRNIRYKGLFNLLVF